MKRILRNSLPFIWPFALLGCYLAYCAAIQYSPLPKTFSSLIDADKCAFKLKFPGIGLSFNRATTDQGGENIRLYEVEYLFREKDRVFVVAGKPGAYRVIDEFTSGPTITSVEFKDGKLRYLDSNDHLIFEHIARK